MTSLDIVTEEEARIQAIADARKAKTMSGGAKHTDSAPAIPKNPKLLGLSLNHFKLKMLRTIPAQVICVPYAV